MYRGLTFLFASTTIILIGVLAWFVAPQLAQHGQITRGDEDIVFPTKVFSAAKAYVAAKGTITADWVGYKNNAYSILCVRDECTVANVEQIGPNQLSSIDGPTTYPVKQWTEDGQVVAEDDALCSRITITLDRKSETVLWVETPINQTALACKNADNTVRKATLETSLYWRKGSKP